MELVRMFVQVHDEQLNHFSLSPSQRSLLPSRTTSASQSLSSHKMKRAFWASPPLLLSTPHSLMVGRKKERERRESPMQIRNERKDFIEF